MDFRSIIVRLEPKLRKLATILNDPSVSPDLRRAAHRSALETIGQAIYDKAYDMSAWDFDIAETLGKIFDRNIASGLARNLSDSVATGDKLVVANQPTTFANTAAQTAVADAFETARSLGKSPRLYARLRGKGDCDWCRTRAENSPHYNPGPALFGRHDKCDCFLEAKGYQSRNGEVRNYRA